jgi:phospholipid-translocating ATPase
MYKYEPAKPKAVESSNDDSNTSKMEKPETLSQSPHDETENESNFRYVYMGPSASNDKHASNYIRTAKYSVISWAPLSLFLQFRRAANIYFLIISVLTAMPFSPKNEISMIGTFSAVLVFTMFKEAFEDYFRYKSDKAVNNSETLVLDKASRTFETRLWKDIAVGDIVKVESDQAFPADLVFLSADTENGLAFINTMNLDGETNLKERVALESTREFRTAEQLSTFNATI